MRLLLDTQIYLWYSAASPKLPKRAYDVIGNATQVYVSAASIWEAAIKIGVGKLSAKVDDLLAGIPGSGFSPLFVRMEHAALVAKLPLHHRDPFDRLLVAQAISETLRLLTADKALTQYSDLVVQVGK
ncbi:MAG: type II toxin-antitoxin system VapC family toxin [Burkholderiales bacterium]